MGGYNQATRPQSMTGQIGYKPLQPWSIESSKPELVTQGISEGIKNLSGTLSPGLSSAIKAKFEAPKTDGLEISKDQIPVKGEAASSGDASSGAESSTSWLGNIGNFFHIR